jgi:hypothetical protein
VTPLAAWLDEVEARAVAASWEAQETCLRRDVPALVGLLRLAVSVVDEARQVSDAGEAGGLLSTVTDGMFSTEALSKALAQFGAAVATLGKETT